MAYQRQNWQVNDAGILRKKDENEEELLVFGYSCKLFRDDEKALYIDQGKQLIPWMGDDSLRIDRYDVRGALYDLSQFEAVSGQQEDNYWINLSAEERRIEQLCDEERYRALTHNEDEERLYQEEELKRLHQALGSDKTYGQVSYSYDDENGEAGKAAPDNQTEDPDEPFVPPPELDLPADIAAVPETVKLNAIIEKTAMFINQQGTQMEIILKMKQASNPQFEFLSYGSSLHSYYRHVLSAIKSGRYKPKVQTNSSTDEKKDEENVSSDQNYYLHHSLSQVPVSSVDVAPVIPSINYKPSSDCAYSMLVNKIRNNQNKLGLLSSVNLETTSETRAEKVEERVPDIVSSPKIYDPSEVASDTREDSDTEMKPSSPQAVAPQRPNRRKRRKRQQGAFVYNDSCDNDSIDGTEAVVEEDCDKPQNADMEIEQNEMPPTDLQLIIDKMASYVGKNGRDFEEIVKSKADPRFSFLCPSNVYYWFYRKKLEFYEELQKPPDNSTSVENIVESSNNTDSVEKDAVEIEDAEKSSDLSCGSSKTASKPNPVCFSIKRPKETEGLEIKSALPIEESSDEDNEGNEDGERCNNAANVDNNVEQRSVENVSVSVKSSEEKKKKSGKSKRSHSNVVKEKKVEKPVKEKKIEKPVKEKKVEKPAKEKLSTKDREKQLQLERKRRAAAFLNMIHKTNKKSPSENSETSVMIGPQLPEDLRVEEKAGSMNGNDIDSDSISSPPSSVTSPDVTFISETTADAAPKNKKGEPSHSRAKSKRSRYSLPESSVASHRLRDRDGVEYKHKHRKRKRSRSPTKKHSHSDRSAHVRRDEEKSKHRKHHKHHRKEWRTQHSAHADKEYSSVHRKHKHYKAKKRKRKDDRKCVTNKSDSSSDSESS